MQGIFVNDIVGEHERFQDSADFFYFDNLFVFLYEQEKQRERDVL
jgi:hypothetical protein